MNSTNGGDNFHSTHEMTPSFPLHNNNNNNNNNKLASYIASYLSGEKKKDLVTMCNRVNPILYEETNNIIKRKNRNNTFKEWLNNQLCDFVRNHSEDLPKCTLDSFKDPDFVACPDFFRPRDVWDRYLQHLSQESFKKWDLHLNELLSLSGQHNKRKFH